MKHSQLVTSKIFQRDELIRQVNRWHTLSKRIVFTNGCFDILHQGHMELLSKAATLGDVLIVGINADASVHRLKGAERPVNNEHFRTQMMASLAIVDGVIIFEEDTPAELIDAVVPDVLVKGGDYNPETVVGAEIVIKNGGEVVIVPLVKGYSTTGLIARIREL